MQLNMYIRAHFFYFLTDGIIQPIQFLNLPLRLPKEGLSASQACARGSASLSINGIVNSIP